MPCRTVREVNACWSLGWWESREGGSSREAELLKLLAIYSLRTSWHVNVLVSRMIKHRQAIASRTNTHSKSHVHARVVTRTCT